MKNRILLLVAVFAMPLFMMANNIRVKLNSYNSTTKQLSLTLAWDNSWHDGGGQFRDAAWLFVKYKDVSNSEWQHAVLVNPTVTTLTDTINTPGVKFDVAGKNASTVAGFPGSLGYIIRRQKATTVALQNNPDYAGVYNVAMNLTATISLPTGMLLGNPEFKVFALEMVDIPSGAFFAGDGTNFSLVKTSATNNAPVQVLSETAALNIQLGSVGLSFPANNTYPKGTAEFFIMKYELSNEGYCEFMNTLTRTQQNALAETSNFATTSSGSTSGFNFYSKFGATFSSLTAPAVFGSDANGNGTFNEANDGQNNGVIVNYMRDVLAYLDWAAIRPMSGFEYEKACRGPVYPVQGEYAWGSAVINAPPIDIDPYGPNETSSVTVDGPAGVYSRGLRNGAFAKATGSTRLNSGGSYYGVMEMSGSCSEPHTSYGESGVWNGTLGNGYVDASYSSLALSVSYTVSYGSTTPVGADVNQYAAASGSGGSYNIGQGIRGVIKF